MGLLEGEVVNWRWRKVWSSILGPLHFQSGRKELQMIFPLKPEGQETQSNLLFSIRSQTGTKSCNCCSDLRNTTSLLQKQRLMSVNNWFQVEEECLNGYRRQGIEVKNLLVGLCQHCSPWNAQGYVMLSYHNRLWLWWRLEVLLGVLKQTKFPNPNVSL